MHHIKNIGGQELEKRMIDMEQIAQGIFEEENDFVEEIFSQMFDEDSGDDELVVTSAQMEAYAEAFTQVEMLAGEYINQHFEGKIVFSKDTKQQKKFSFDSEQHTYYCYLDIYLEAPDGSMKIFEVKSTTTNKFYELGRDLKLERTRRKQDGYDSIFIEGVDKVIRLKEEADSQLITDLKKYQNYRNKLFDRYGSDGCGKYVFDLAVERFIVEQSMKEKNDNRNVEYFLVVLNGDYIYDGYREDGKCLYRRDDIGNEIISIIDLSLITKEWQPIISDLKKQIEETISEYSIYPKKIGKFCEHKKSTQCIFQPICFKEVSQPGSILEYIRKTHAFSEDGETIDVFDLINRGCYQIDSIPRSMLSKKINLIQYDCFVEHKVFSRKNKMLAVLNDLEYPLYHLDFESFGGPLPRYRGEKPYSQSVFQFSIHIEREPGVCDKVGDHREFLAPDHDDHRYRLCQAMIELIDLKKGGSVVVYNQGFEKSRLRELAEIFPEISESLLRIRDHVFDLLNVLKGNMDLFLPYTDQTLSKKEREESAKLCNYYHSKMKGSFSIKKVLPIFTSLTYEGMEVSNGTEAVLAYALLPMYSPDEYQSKYLALRKYCQQDTWAMVEILWGIKRLHDEN